VRQLTDESGAVTLAQNYDPYGVAGQSAGAGSTHYGFTGEQVDSDGLVYLRARYYSSDSGRFITRDTWEGDAKRPMSFNSWNYGLDNPSRYTDPTGNISCEDSNDAICMAQAQKLKSYGLGIQEAVRQGSLLPVEGLAEFADYAMPLFDNDMRGAMWALTITIDGMDANKGMVWPQANGQKDKNYWLQYDWLPYQNNPDFDKASWDKGRPWIHSRRGDWRVDYWDKTANQAYHFWYFAAVSYFDGAEFARLANFVHEGYPREDITKLKDWEAPSSAGNTDQDWNLSGAGEALGDRLVTDRNMRNIRTYCYPGDPILQMPYSYTNLGAWIRANLKGAQTDSSGGRR
jgi:RHS repeat-associated protein